MPPGASANSVASVIARTLAPSYLRGLGRMRLSVRRALGPRPGNTPLTRGSQPTGIEIERYKNYDTGDELRFVDWNAYARLDQFHVRRFRAEREAPLHVFVDASASMAVPAADEKFSFAIGLALSLAYVALRRNDPVRLVVLGQHGNGDGYLASSVVRLPVMLRQIADFCAPLQPQGPTLLARGIEACVQRTRTPGLAVVISDFLLQDDSWRDVLRRLAGRRFEVAALRPLGEIERDPSRAFRRARIRDSETGAERVVTLGERNLRRYQEALERHLEDLRATCRSHAAHFAVCHTSSGLEHCMSHTLPRAGVLR